MKFNRSRIKIALILFGLFALFACLSNTSKEVTSTSVTTGNPTGIHIQFEPDSPFVTKSGRVEIFAVTQLPVPSYQPLPLAIIPFEKSKEVWVDSSIFKSIPDSIWPASSIEGDSVFKFNIIVAAENSGAIFYDFGFNRRTNKFTASIDHFPLKGGAISISESLKPYFDLYCHIDPQTLSPTKHHFLFIKGTGFITKGSAGNFTFKSLPMGTYRPTHIPIPDDKNGTVSVHDYLFIYDLLSPVSTGESNEVTIRGVIDSVAYSDSLMAVLNPGPR
jgi:hypothetical protein